MKAIRTILISSLLGLAACGGSSDAKDPSKVDPTKTDTTSAMPAPADTTTKPVDATPTPPAPTASAVDAKPPMDAKPSTGCKDAPKVTATTKKQCMTDCSKLESTVPAGSKCIPPKVACESQCSTMKP